jgi:EAL domain-containing protein (putative c-di-GMP-specific phosphodiesterase class I)/GGDEF domain-containing protein
LKLIEDLLAEVTALALTSNDKASFRQGVVDLMVELDSVCLVWISVLDDDGEGLRPVAAAGEPLWYVNAIRARAADGPASEGPTGIAFRTRKLQFFDDAATDPRMAHWRERAARANLRAGVAVPLISADRLIGLLGCFSHEVAAFTPELREGIQLVSDAVSLSWEAIEQRDSVLQSGLRIANYADKYFRALEDAPLGLAIFDTSFRAVRTNRFLRDMVGIPLGLDGSFELDELFANAKSRSVARDAIRGIQQGAAQDSGTRRPRRRLLVRSSFHEEIWVQCSFAALNSESDRSVQVVCLFEDLSGPLGVRAALLFSQRALDLAAGAVPMTVFRTDDDGTIQLLAGEAFIDLARAIQMTDDIAPVPTDPTLSQGASGGQLVGTVLGDHDRYVSLWAQRREGSHAYPSITGAAIDVSDLERSRDEAQRSARLNASLAHVARTALANPEIGTLITQACAEIDRVLPGHTVRVSDIDTKGFVSPNTHEGSMVAMDTPSTSAILMRLRRTLATVVLTGGAEDDPLWSSLDLIPSPTSSTVILPISTKASVKYLIVLHAEQARHYAPDEMSYFAAMSNIVSSLLRRREAEHLVLQLGRTDGVTGLPLQAARLEFLERLTDRVPNDGVTVLTCSLTDMVSLTENFGHEVTETILLIFADLLRAYLSDWGQLFLTGAGEVSVVRSGVVPLDLVAREVIGPLRQAIREPIDIHGAQFILDCTCSVVTFASAERGQHATPHEMATLAESIHRNATHLHSDLYVDEESARARRPLRHSFATRLTSAVEEHQLTLMYQPKLDLASGKVSSFEALVRWRNEDGTFNPPDAFIPLAEKLGLINALTDDVLFQAMEGLAKLQTLDRQLTVAINLSQECLADRWYLEKLCDVATERYGPGVILSHVVFEITETATIGDSSSMLDGLLGLGALGARFSIDDFGTGYTSLSYLSRLPLSELKIDKSFVAEMATNQRVASLVQSGLRMGALLGLDTVAEGVETDEQLRMLRTLGCTHAQGYGIARPMVIDDAVAWLDTWTPLPT